MLNTEKMEAESLIKNLPAKSTFEDIQYHLFVAEKLKNARQQVKEGKVFSHEEVKNKLSRWIIK